MWDFRLVSLKIKDKKGTFKKHPALLQSAPLLVGWFGAESVWISGLVSQFPSRKHQLQIQTYPNRQAGPSQGKWSNPRATPKDNSPSPAPPNLRFHVAWEGTPQKKDGLHQALVSLGRPVLEDQVGPFGAEGVLGLHQPREYPGDGWILKPKSKHFTATRIQNRYLLPKVQHLKYELDQVKNLHHSERVVCPTNSQITGVACHEWCEQSCQRSDLKATLVLHEQNTGTQT